MKKTGRTLRRLAICMCLIMAVNIVPVACITNVEAATTKKQDTELKRIKTYKLVDDAAFKNLNQQVTTGKYYDSVLRVLKKTAGKKAVTEYKTYFKKNFNRKSKIKVCDAMFMSYLAMYVTGHKFALTDDWESMVKISSRGFDGDVQQIYSTKAYNLKKENITGMGYFELETRACFMNTLMISPISGYPIFDVGSEKKNMKFSGKKCTNEITIRSIGRLYEYIGAEKIWKSVKKDSSIEAEIAAKKSDILSDTSTVNCRGTTYYVAENGSDENDGKSQEHPWKSLRRVNSATLQAGDAVMFKRGDEFRGTIYAKTGVTYTAYGSGNKPVFKTAEKDTAGEENWILYAKGKDGSKVWKYKEKTVAVGNVFFDNYTSYALKYSPYYKNKTYYCYEDDKKKFNVKKHLKNLEFFTTADKNCDDVSQKGELYLRCDQGNPGKIYRNIEFATVETSIVNANDCTYRNLCFYSSQGLTRFGTGHDHLRFEYCEVGYMGGCVCGYDNEGFPQNGGDGITMGGNYNLAKNNYVHDCMDHGCTLELTVDEQGKSGFTDNVFDGNVIERCDGGFLFANWSCNDPKNGPVFHNVNISNNYVAWCGYGFGAYINRERQEVDRISAIDNGGNYRYAKYDNVNVTNNVFYISKYTLVNAYSKGKEQIHYQGNTYANSGLFCRSETSDNWMILMSIENMNQVKKYLNDKDGIYKILK